MYIVALESPLSLHPALCTYKVHMFIATHEASLLHSPALCINKVKIYTKSRRSSLSLNPGLRIAFALNVLILTYQNQSKNTCCLRASFLYCRVFSLSNLSRNSP